MTEIAPHLGVETDRARARVPARAFVRAMGLDGPVILTRSRRTPAIAEK